jgi:hypothetical protein
MVEHDFRDAGEGRNAVARLGSNLFHVKHFWKWSEAGKFHVKQFNIYPEMGNVIRMNHPHRLQYFSKK